MKKTFKIFMLALIAIPFLFTACKKGEGDPFLSLKSRKARFAGEWKVTAGKGSNTSSSNYTTSWTYDGTQEVTTYPAPLGTSTDKYTITYKIEKDGTFENIATDNNGSTPEVTTTKGTWNFTGGVGEKKNKSQVLFTILSIASSGGTITYTGSDAPTHLIDLYQLKNKEIIVKSKGTTSDGSSEESEWTWTAQ